MAINDLPWDGSKLLIFDNCVVDIFLAEEYREKFITLTDGKRISLNTEKRFIITKKTYVLTFNHLGLRITCLAILLVGIKKGISACILDEMKCLFGMEKTGTHLLKINQTPQILFVNSPGSSNSFPLPFYTKKNFLLFRVGNYDEEGNIIPDPPLEDIFDSGVNGLITSGFQKNMMVEILTFRILFGVKTSAKNIRIRKRTEEEPGRNGEGLGGINQDLFYPVGCFETKMNFTSKYTQNSKWFTECENTFEQVLGRTEKDRKYFLKPQKEVKGTSREKFDFGRIISSMARISLNPEEINFQLDLLFTDMENVILRIDPGEVYIMTYLRNNMMMLLDPVIERRTT